MSREAAESRCHGVRNVVELKIEEDFLSTTTQFGEKCGPLGVKQFHPDLVPENGVPQPIHQFQCGLATRNVKRDNQPFLIRIGSRLNGGKGLGRHRGSFARGHIV